MTISGKKASEPVLPPPIRTVKHIAANTDPAKCPAPDHPEYAFTGRSNVGKSSLINMLVNRRGMARISGSPGKTQTINHYLVNESWYLVDLPGYGYARVSKAQRDKWIGFTNRYLTTRENLMCLFVLVDGRIEPQGSDISFIHNLGLNRIPFIVLITKADKVTSTQLNKNVTAFQEALKPAWEELPRIIITSAPKKKGRGELLDLIEETNLLFNQPRSGM